MLPTKRCAGRVAAARLTVPIPMAESQPDVRGHAGPFSALLYANEARCL
jgi:hypothetical protein